MIPFPSVEQAFARVRREEGRQGVMLGKPTGSIAMVSNGKRPILKTPSEFVANNYKEGQTSQDKSHLKCTICGARRHTKDMCFFVVGYPEWYIELQNRKGRKPKRGAGNAIIGFDPTGQKDPPTSVPSGAVLAATGSARPRVSGSGHQAAAGSIEPGFFGHTTESTDGAGLPNQLSLLPMGEGKMACAFISKTNKCDGWIIDSGASDHMTYDPGDFVKQTNPRRSEIMNANGGIHLVTGAGTVELTSNLSLPNTLLVPPLSTKLIFVGQIAEDLNCVILMYPSFCLFQDVLSKKIIGRGSRRGRLYHLDDICMGRANHTETRILDSRPNHQLEKIMVWHKRLGHPSFSYMKKLVPNLFQTCDTNLLECETCVKAKSHRVSFYSNNKRSTVPFSLVHSDIWGPSPVNTIFGNKYFVTFIDDCTRITWLYLLKTKSEVSRVFKGFHHLVSTQYGKDIKVFRSDNGGEFVNKNLKEYFHEKGLIHETSCAGTPQQNGVAERKYITQPPGFIVQEEVSKVCLLRKSLYVSSNLLELGLGVYLKLSVILA